MEKLKLDFVLFDMIGTTIQDANNGKSLILDSFHNAFSMNGYEISYDQLNQERGKTKRIAIKNILEKEGTNLELTEKIYADFMGLLNQSVHSFHEIVGTSRVFKLLKSKGVKIGIGSGLPLAFMQKLIDHLGWSAKDFDYIGSSDDLAAGRPDPIMILTAMDQLKLTNPQQILKIGDTVVDVMEGKNASVKTAMVLTGTQQVSDLGDILPDFIFESVVDLEHIFDEF